MCGLSARTGVPRSQKASAHGASQRWWPLAEGESCETLAAAFAAVSAGQGTRLQAVHHASELLPHLCSRFLSVGADAHLLYN